VEIGHVSDLLGRFRERPAGAPASALKAEPALEGLE
jgi:hypothetical protein